MSSMLSQILDRIDVILKASAPVGTTVWRDRADAESRSEAPGINVLAREGSVSAFAHDKDKHDTQIELRIRVRAEPGTPSAETVHAAVHTALMRDGTLQQMTIWYRLTEYSFDIAEADLTELKKTVRYRFIYLVPSDQI